MLWKKLTTCGLNGGSNNLLSNFFQSISLKKTFSVISSCGLFGEPSLVVESFSINCLQTKGKLMNIPKHSNWFKLFYLA